jgi:hypothetical protein
MSFGKLFGMPKTVSVITSQSCCPFCTTLRFGAPLQLYHTSVACCPRWRRNASRLSPMCDHKLTTATSAFISTQRVKSLSSRRRPHTPALPPSPSPPILTPSKQTAPRTLRRRTQGHPRRLIIISQATIQASSDRLYLQ